MATALISGLLDTGALPRDHVRCSDASADRRKLIADEHGIETGPDNAAIVEWADCVVLAVKPQIVETALLPCRPKFSSAKLLVSVCAGVPVERLSQLCGAGTRVVRAMPNTPALVRQGASALTGGGTVSDSDARFVTELFGAVGKCWWVDESQMDAVTGLSGSGPAYVMLFIESLADGGVRAGLPRQVATELAVQTVLGSATLAAQESTHTAALKDRVTSPAGTTIEGVYALERGGFRGVVINAVCEASARSRQLGAKSRNA
jgi:pyrroline-5-carboxylate reductase